MFTAQNELDRTDIIDVTPGPVSTSDESTIPDPSQPASTNEERPSPVPSVVQRLRPKPVPANKKRLPPVPSVVQRPKPRPVPANEERLPPVPSVVQRPRPKPVPTRGTRRAHSLLTPPPSQQPLPMSSPQDEPDMPTSPAKSRVCFSTAVRTNPVIPIKRNLGRHV